MKKFETKKFNSHTGFNFAGIFAIALSVNLSSCGKMDYKSDYNSEKSKRTATEKQLSDEKSDNTDLRNFLTRMTFTPHYAWIYHGKLLMNDKNNSAYTQYQQLCEDVGFELPTTEMATEAETNPDLKKVMYLQDGWRTFAIKDQPVPADLWVVLCAKKI